jgi:thiamine-phosphate pyrophosphorylase
LQDSLTDTYRILDAAANRTREGLRVVEDFVRMALNDAHLSRVLKELRHDFASAISHLNVPSLLAARDTTHDVGTTIGVASEYRRDSPAEIASASFKRVQEALRTMEEYSKMIDPAPAAQFEQLRYRSYTIEKAVLRTDSARYRIRDQRLYLLVTASQCVLGFETVVKTALDAGVRLIQMREKSLADRELIKQARLLREWTSAVDCLLIINDRPDVAALSDADGVHVGQEELTVQDARRIIGPDRLVGVSTHSLEQAREAVLDGADYLGVGPTFPSGTKSFQDFPGLPLIREVAGEIQLPWFAIGGIDDSNLADLLAAGANRVAMSGAICRSGCPADLIRHVKSLLDIDA